jgi:flavin reductase (DIM6/NTAB) family NADH-FMN oxidoreductase RutF
VLTSKAEDEIAAATITWLSQASFNPPMIMVAMGKDSNLHKIVMKAGTFAAHIVSEDQKELAASFFKAAKISPGMLNDYEYHHGPETGSPILQQVKAWYEARVVKSFDEGDHTVILAEIISGSIAEADFKPLTLRDTGWKYSR